MMITLVLSSNMKKMIKDNVLVRRLVGIETSGSLNILLCDKTGTLTEGKLKVTKLLNNDIEINDYTDLNKYKKYKEILCDSLYLNNECQIINNSIIGGNSTDKSIIEFIKNHKTNDKVIYKKDFSSETKYSYVVTNNGYYYYKGAKEVLLKKCKRYIDINGNILKFNSDNTELKIKKYTSLGYRVLVNAFNNNKDEDNLIFINIIIIRDNIRLEAKESINDIQNAGVKVIMITGDAKETAINIAKELNIYSISSLVYTHDELCKISDEELNSKSNNISIIARALPEDKERLVRIFKNQNKIVGMTGDGVNDVLALKKSDVGFSMGSGSEVAKEASDIVILDNNIKSICKAILYGRTIFKSIRKFIIYQCTVNICALLLSIIAPFLGITTPITIIQMLWLNMIMDTFAGLAFSYESPLKEYLQEKPKEKNEKIMNKYMYNQIIVNGIYSFILCILLIKVPFFQFFFRTSNNNEYILTAFFALFIFSGIINSFLSRSHRLNIFANILKNKVFLIINVFIIIVQIYIIYYGGSLFRTYGLTIKELVIVLLLSFTILPIDLIRKKILKIKNISLGV